MAPRPWCARTAGARAVLQLVRQLAKIKAPSPGAKWLCSGAGGAGWRWPRRTAAHAGDRGRICRPRPRPDPSFGVSGFGGRGRRGAGAAVSSSERGSVAQKQATLGQYDSPSLVVSIWPAAGTSNRKRALDRERGRRRYARLPDARQTRAATYGHLRTLSRVAAAEASLMCHPGHK
jgi:hypothetical protein